MINIQRTKANWSRLATTTCEHVCELLSDYSFCETEMLVAVMWCFEATKRFELPSSEPNYLNGWLYVITCWHLYELLMLTKDKSQFADQIYNISKNWNEINHVLTVFFIIDTKSCFISDLYPTKMDKDLSLCSGGFYTVRIHWLNVFIHIDILHSHRDHYLCP